MASELRFTIGARTDAGKQRAVNEDAVAILDAAGLGLSVEAAFVVADGMGGMQAGDVASREAVRAVQETLTKRLAGPGADPRAALVEALRRANEIVYALAQGALAAASAAPDEAPTAVRGPGEGHTGDADAPGLMGTTCVAGVVTGAALHLAHVGDSRAYLLREGRLSRLTRDHSFVEERVLAGDLTEEEARKSRFRNMITRAIGIDADVEPELKEVPMQAGDTLLVCTDGLTTMLPDAHIEATLTRTEVSVVDIEKAAGALVDAANRKGGSDNVTVLLLRAEAAANGVADLPLGGAVRGAPVGRLGSGDTVPPANRRRPVRRDNGGEPPAAPAAVDLDVPSRRQAGAAARAPQARRRTSPLLGFLALLGASALLLAAALGFSPDLRERASALLGAAPGGAAPSPPDLSRLTYSAAERFAPILARGDLLAYSPRGYLYVVGFATGKVAALSRTGEVLNSRSVAHLEVAPVPENPPAKTRSFLTTDVQGNVYISYTRRKIIEKRDPQGRVLRTIKGFQRPEAVAVDEDGNLYVVDANDIKILRAQLPRPGGAPAGAAPGPKPAAGGGARP